MLKFINNNENNDPALNLALEEYCLDHMDLNHHYLLFYVNKPSVIIGKHQNTYEEINSDYIQQNDIQVVRRISGGGAVYHDFGNLNFSFLSSSEDKVFNDFRIFTAPIIQALNALGIPAELSGRNDMIVQGKKISGNAQYRRGQRMFCHGTLLFNSDIDAVVAALNVKTDKIQSKGIKSIRSRVANINEFLTSPINMTQFKEYLIHSIVGELTEENTWHFSQEDWQEIEKLANEKYRSWDWNYGKSPEFNYQNRKRFPCGEIDVRLHIKEGLITDSKIFGDFFAEHDIAALEQALLNIPYERQALSLLLDNTHLEYYLPTLTRQDWIDLLIDQSS